MMTRQRSSQAKPDWASVLLLAASSLPVCIQFIEQSVDYRFDGLQSRAFAPALHLGLSVLLLACLGSMRRMLLLLAPVAVLALPEAIYMACYKLPSGPSIYGIIADTNWEEVRSWVGPWLWPGAIAALVWLALVARLSLIAWHQDWRWTHRSRHWVLGAAAVTIAGLWAVQWRLGPALDRIEEVDASAYLQHSINAPLLGAMGNIEPIFPWGLPLRWQHFNEHLQALSSHRESARNFDFGIQWRATWPTAEREIHVLVIGETGRPDRWQLFGAKRATTPRLAARTDLITFSDVVSPAAATRESVPMMLTRRPPAAPLVQTDEPSIVTAYRQAGYRSYWLSTQGAAGRHETPISVLAAEADEQHFINAVDYRSAGALDGELLPLMKQILARNEPRQLIVLHTLGSHLNYSQRYPKSFEQFVPALSPEQVPDIWQPTQAPLLINAYDNSVLYTDHLLSEAIGMVEATGASATLLYAADHGETLFDGMCKRGGHGFDAETNYRVPMLVWTSPRWMNAHPAAMAAMRTHANSPISTLSVFATMTGLGGFNVAKVGPNGDLTQPGWLAASRPVTHYGDFDRNLKGKTCSSS